MRNAIRTITLCLLCLGTIKAQDFHLQTNVTQVPCQKIYYTGILADGGKCESVVLDHNCEIFERNMSNWTPGLVFVLRSSVPQDATIVWHDRAKLDGVAALQRNPVPRPYAGDGPRPKQSVTPPLPPLPAPLQRKAISAPAPIPPQPYPTTAAADDPAESSADGTPPYPSIINYYDLPFAYQCRNNMGQFYDPLGQGPTSNRLEAIWVTPAGSYSTWWYCTNDVGRATNWHKFPDSASCPTASETNIFYLPVMPRSQRFYWLRGT